MKQINQRNREMMYYLMIETHFAGFFGVEYTFWAGAQAWLLFGRSFFNHDASSFPSQYV